ncbi:PIN domain-containing protein [Streptomyces sp. DH18]|uniref:PIN domain-containing protein n=1 Tax=Streptomyces sp. DH18 TaxID=3040126 RepID=UPI002441A9C7|nr:PIN domain-containing protein [Streptomyces sp. DH18]MDG9687829.1 PIN domain-containing protein [Streptomyces sp. DH18]
MIILDTCVIRSMKHDGSDAHLLRAIRDVNAERVGVPWMVMEERAAQLAIKYRETYGKAAQALEQLRAISPGSVPDLAEPDEEAVREQFRDQLRGLAEILPTSEAALREGVVRESNSLAPAGMKKGEKVGARDVAIWLSAVEYVKTHPYETVYFVSSNTRDFTAGDSSYPSPMDADIDGLGDRFVHLPQLADLLKIVAPPFIVNPDRVRKLLPSFIPHFHKALMLRWGSPVLAMFSPFPALSQAAGAVKEAKGWFGSPQTTQLQALQVTDIQGYRLGDQEWCIASIQWQVMGWTQFSDGMSMGCCTWTTRILLPLVEDGPSPRILDASGPEAPADGQKIEWVAPTYIAPMSLSQREALLSSYESSSKVGRAFLVAAHALQSITETGRMSQIRASLESDGAAASAVAEDWDDGEDEEARLRGDWL